MPPEFKPNDEIKNLIEKIIVKNGLKNVKDVKYRTGSNAGDGYVSKTVAVDIVHDGGILTPFLKYAQNLKSSESMPLEKLYANEIYFYDVVYPAFLEFLTEKNAEKTFDNVPKCYGTSDQGGIVALENLKLKGFRLYDKRTVMERPHLELVLRTFAKFHAISFAFKDQRREKYRELVDNSYEDFFAKIMESPAQRKMFGLSVEQFLKRLDPVEDRHILEKCGNLAEILSKTFSGTKDSSREYSILTQGDCWCNNMMFLYPESDPNHPVDVVLIDWQVLRVAPPIFDMAYFFYTIASATALDELDYYLRLYHQELSDRIKDLGSDPQILYPFSVLEEHWKQYGKYGFAVAFLLIRGMLTESDEIIDLEGVDFEDEEGAQKWYTKIRRDDEYFRRMKLLIEHFAKKDLL